MLSLNEDSMRNRSGTLNEILLLKLLHEENRCYMLTMRGSGKDDFSFHMYLLGLRDLGKGFFKDESVYLLPMGLVLRFKEACGMLLIFSYLKQNS